MRTRRELLVNLTALLAIQLAATRSSADADVYPKRVVKLLVPFGPGGSTDILSRILAKELAEEFAVGVIVENRAGAGSIIGTQAVARSPADGYTILMTGMPFSALPAVSPNLPFDPIADFVPIINLGLLPTILVIPAANPANTLQEYVAFVKKNPRQLNYSSAGIGSLNHLAGELFARLVGVEMTHVPYQSGGQAVMAMLTGDTDLLFTTIPPSMQQLRAGKLRAIAISNPVRSKALPNVPTFAESGMPDFKSAYWQGLLAPVNTPSEIVNKVNTACNKILRSAAMKVKLDELGIEGGGGTPNQFKELIRDDIQQWHKVLKEVMPRRS